MNSDVRAAVLETVETPVFVTAVAAGVVVTGEERRDGRRDHEHGGAGERRAVPALAHPS
jgi:hypothetical protein